MKNVTSLVFAEKEPTTYADTKQTDQLSSGQDYFFIRKNSMFTKVAHNDILWIAALGDYVTIHTKDQRFILHITFKSLEDKLPPGKFVRVHRSYIVQLDTIKVVEDTSIFIDNASIPIPIGPLYKKNFIGRLNPLG